MNLTFGVKCIIAVVILLTIFAICIWQYIMLDSAPYPTFDDRLFYRALCLIGALIGSITTICIGIEYFREDACVIKAHKEIESKNILQEVREKIDRDFEIKREQLETDERKMIEELNKLSKELQLLNDERTRLQKENTTNSLENNSISSEINDKRTKTLEEYNKLKQGYRIIQEEKTKLMNQRARDLELR